MGCDIHFYVEHRVGDEWAAADVRAGGKSALNDGPANEIYIDRNYGLFAILAGVRNDDGYYSPISLPRGVPEDASPEYRQAVEAYEFCSHSHSWLLLSELLAFDWLQTTGDRDWVDPETYPEPAHIFWAKVMPILLSIAKGRPDDVRVLFFFDN